METAAEFVEGFRRYWSAPSLDGLSVLLAPDVTIVQPLAPRMRGLDEVRRQFGAIFAWLPDLRAEVASSGSAPRSAAGPSSGRWSTASSSATTAWRSSA